MYSKSSDFVEKFESPDYKRATCMTPALCFQLDHISFPIFLKLLPASRIEFNFYTENINPLLSRYIASKNWVPPGVMTCENVPIVYEINPPNQTPDP